MDDDEANPALEALITELNVIAKRFNTIVARREQAGKKGGGEHTTTTAGTVETMRSAGKKARGRKGTRRRRDLRMC